MKKALIIILAITALAWVIDYQLSIPVIQLGKVVDKTFAPAPSGELDYLIVVIQPDRQCSYFLRVPYNYFDDTRIGDRLPLRKRHGLITGIEYSHDLLTN